MAACLAFCFGGCNALSVLTGDDSASTVVTGGDSGGTIVTDGSTLGDGREVDGYADGRMGDTLVNEFFSYCVNEAELAREYGGEAPQDGNVFLVAELTVKNVFGEPIPMYSSDFQVQWGEGDEDYGFPIDKFTDGQMDDEYEMPRGQSITATVVYEIPELSGTNEYSISYQEVYEDDVEGNVFFIYFDLDTPA